MIPVFDHHIHMDARNCNDYELMALANVGRILVPCSPTRERKFCRQGWSERFDKLINFERARAAAFGIELYVALSVNAVDVGDYRSAYEGLEEVEARLGHSCVRAVGEMAFREGTDGEADLLERHLKLAAAKRLPAIVEAPIEMNVFERMLRVLEERLPRSGLDPRRLCMVDLNHAKLRSARRLNLGGYGLPVSPKVDGPFSLREKLDYQDVLRVLDEFGPECIMLNSGLHAGYADPLCLPRTVLRLELQGLDRQTLRALACDNAESFFLKHAT